MTCKQQKFIVHSSRGSQIRDQDQGAWWGSRPGSQTAVFRLCPYLAEEERELSGSFYKGTNPIREGSIFTIYSFPKGPTSNYHHNVG